MNCPMCNSKSINLDTRPNNGQIRRRKQCLACKMKFTTYELLDEVYEDLTIKKVNILNNLPNIKKCRWTEKEDKRLLEMRLEGYKSAEIAFELERSKVSVANRVITLRKRGEDVEQRRII